MTRKELIKKSAFTAGISQVNCEKALDAIIIEATKCLACGDKVHIDNFMSFEITEMAERTCKHPRTGEITTFPAVKYIKCKPSLALKRAINQK